MSLSTRYAALFPTFDPAATKSATGYLAIIKGICNLTLGESNNVAPMMFLAD